MDQYESLWDKLGNGLMEVLPTSPFRGFLDEFADLPFLGYLNWFVPVRSILVVLSAWLGAVALFYAYSIVMRWLKVIGD